MNKYIHKYRLGNIERINIYNHFLKNTAYDENTTYDENTAYDENTKYDDNTSYNKSLKINKDKNKSIIFHFEANRGYGDFIRGLTNSILLSFLTNKNLFIYTQSKFIKILNLPFIDNINDIEYTEFDIFDYRVREKDNIIKDSINILREKDLQKYFENKNVIIKSNICILKILLENKFYKDVIPLIRNIYKNFYSLFPLNKNASTNINDDYYNRIAIHIRAGDHFLCKNIDNYEFKHENRITSFDKIFSLLKNIRKYYPNDKFFICSDNKIVYENALNIFGDSLVCIGNNIENIHSNFIDDNNIDLLEIMIKEHYILSKSKIILSNHSQFSLTAALIGDVPQFSIENFDIINFDKSFQLI